MDERMRVSLDPGPGHRRAGAVGRLCAAVCASVIVLGSLAGVSAQEATPAVSGTAAELHVTITDTGFDLSARQVPAGQVRLSVENSASDATESADADLLLPPEGTAIEDVLADIALLNGDTSATPSEDDTAASPEAGGEPEIPAWIYQATWAGGPIVPAGGSVQSVVTLTPGTWVLFNGSFGSPQQPTTLEVTAGSADGAASEPAFDAEVSLQEYAFTGLEQGLQPGTQTWKVTNVGAQPHFLALVNAPDGITKDEVMTILASDGPAADSPYQDSDFDFNQPGLGLLSTGQTSLLTLDLQPGTYIALCFVPDIESGMPHVMLGMIEVFTVGGDASATPAA